MKIVNTITVIVMCLIAQMALAQNTFPTSGPATINYDDGAALRIKNWNRFGSTYGGHIPYWGMNVHHTSSGWHSFHPSLRGSLILNYGNYIYLSSAPANTTGNNLTHHLVVDNVNDRIGIGTSSPNYKLDVAGRIHSNDRIYGNRLSSTGGVIDLQHLQATFGNSTME